ncbi:hypothetical protein ABLE68_18970 [Nocardioides sp. CN2-186]|uniref:hypothetical protein n=1 Tax=Nocardioides tweenelious TaxID=3156607 RepID=UPI0032B5C7B2
MASKSSIQKLQDLVVGTVKGVVHDPAGSAGKAVQQAKGTFAIGREMAGQVARSATHRAVKTTGTVAAFVPSPRPEAEPAAPLVEKPTIGTPADVAKVVEKKSPTEKAAVRKAPAKKAPAKKAPSSPSAKLPPRKKV